MNLRGARPIPNHAVSEFVASINIGTALSDPNISREFMRNWLQWISSSKRNKLRGLAGYTSIRLTAGSAQIFDHFYIKHHTRRFRVLRWRGIQGEKPCSVTLGPAVPCDLARCSADVARNSPTVAGEGVMFR